MSKEDLLLFSEPLLVCDTYSGKSKFPFWHNIEVGHKLRVMFVIKEMTRSGSGLYAPELTVENIDTGEEMVCTLNALVSYFRKLKLKGDITEKIYY